MSDRNSPPTCSRCGWHRLPGDRHCDGCARLDRLEREEKEQNARAQADFKARVRCPLRKDGTARAKKRKADLKQAVRSTKRAKKSRPSGTHETPWGRAHAMSNGDLLVFYPAAKPEYRAWCAKREQDFLHARTFPDVSYVYTGPIIVEQGEEIPAGYVEHAGQAPPRVCPRPLIRRSQILRVHGRDAPRSAPNPTL